MKSADIKKLYGKSVRLRVCGLYVENNELLMVEHSGLGKNDVLWIPPGGGVEYSHSIEENLQREFFEETGLKVNIEEFLFVYEYINAPLHAVELFYKVSKVSGKIETGFDPEYSEENQIIESVKMLPFSKIDLMNKEILHGIFSQCEKSSELINQRGFFKFENNP